MKKENEKEIFDKIRILELEFDEDWLEWERQQERDPQIVAEDLDFMSKEETGNNLEED